MARMAIKAQQRLQWEGGVQQHRVARSMVLPQEKAWGTVNVVFWKQRRRWHKIQIRFLWELEEVQRDLLQRKQTAALYKVLFWSVANLEYVQRRFYTHLTVAQRKLTLLVCKEKVSRQQLIYEESQGEEDIRRQACRQRQEVPYAELLAK